MFYCDACAETSGYPQTGFRSRGPCEICGQTANCNDTPSRLLPYPKWVTSEQAAEFDKIIREIEAEERRTS